MFRLLEIHYSTRGSSKSSKNREEIIGKALVTVTMLFLASWKKVKNVLTEWIKFGKKEKDM